MSKITLQPILRKKGISMTFIILCSLFVYGNAFSVKRWDRNNILVSVDSYHKTLSIKILFIDYEFGQLGEHAYFEELEMLYNIGGLYYRKLFNCQVQDQILSSTSLVYIADSGENIDFQFAGCIIPEDGTLWPKDTNIEVQVKNISKKGYITIFWKLPTVVRGIDNFLARGKWHVNGLFCSEKIVDVVYKMPQFRPTDPTIETEEKQNKVLDRPRNNAIAISKDADAVVIKGVERGNPVNVYTISGMPVNTTVANDDVVKFKLPANHIYIVNVGEVRYKVAM